MSSLPSFPPLQDPVSNDGQPWHRVLEGDAAAAKNAGAVLTAKDESGNLDYLNIDDQGRVKTISNLEDTIDLDGEGDNAGNNSSFQTLFDIILQATTVYKDLEWVFACFREATYEIVAIDDRDGSPTEVILATIKVGAGAFTHASKKTSRFTSGSTGVIVLRVRAKNLNATSQLEACLSAKEVQ